MVFILKISITILTSQTLPVIYYFNKSSSTTQNAALVQALIEMCPFMREKQKRMETQSSLKQYSSWNWISSTLQLCLDTQIQENEKCQEKNKDLDRASNRNPKAVAPTSTVEFYLKSCHFGQEYKMKSSHFSGQCNKELYFIKSRKIVLLTKLPNLLSGRIQKFLLTEKQNVQNPLKCGHYNQN